MKILDIEKELLKLYKIYSEIYVFDKIKWEEMYEEKKLWITSFENIDLDILDIDLKIKKEDIINYSKIIEEKDIFFIDAYEKMFYYELNLYKIYKKYNFENISTMKYEKIIQILKERLYEDDKNVYELFKISIAMEKLAEKIYTSFIEKFKDNERAVEIFTLMRNDEISHRKTIEHIFKTQNEEDLSQKIKLDVIYSNYVNGMLILYIENEEIKTLIEAVEKAHQLENSEINILFEFIVLNFIKEEDRKDILLLQLNGHNQRLVDFTHEIKRLGM